MSEIFKVKVYFSDHPDGFRVDRVVEELASGKKVEHEEFVDGQLHKEKNIPKSSIASMLNVDLCYVEEG